MTYPKDIVRVFIIRDDQKSEYTDGTISIDISRGVDEFQGIFQVPDVGQLTLVSRNKNLDPHVNDLVRYNSVVSIETGELANERVFRGFITDINVEYNPQDGDTITTINATTVLGLLQRAVINDDFATYLHTTYPSGINIKEFLQELFTSNNSGLNFNLGSINSYMEAAWEWSSTTHNTGPLAKIRFEAGDNILDAILKLSQSSLTNFSELSPNLFYLYPYIKYSSDYFTSTQDWIDYNNDNPFIYFASDGTQSSYKSIEFDDGFGRTVNQVVFNNHQTTPTISDTTYGPYQNLDSVTDWGTSTVQIDTLFSGITTNTSATYLDYATTILQTGSIPKLEVKTITFDNTKVNYLENNFPKYSIGFYDSPIRIKHDINESLTVDKLYLTVGRKDRITPYDWQTTYVVAPHPFYDAAIYQGTKPTITLNAPTTNSPDILGDGSYYYYGDTNFNFIANISGIDSALVDKVGWQFGEVGLMNDPNDPNNIFAFGKPYTFNFDVPIGQTGTGGYPGGGPGWTPFRAWVYLKNGWVIITDQAYINVTAAETHAGFSYSGSYGTINFVDTSYDAQSWSWNFGDGSTSTLQNPVHHYNGTGNYNVTLTVSNGVDTDSITQTVNIVLSKISVNYVKFEWKGIKNIVSGAWNKDWLTKVVYIDLPTTVMLGWSVPSNFDAYANVTKNVIKGDIKKENGTTWNANQNILNPWITINSDQMLTDYSRYTTYVEIEPEYSPLPNYNQAEFDASLIFKVGEWLDALQAAGTITANSAQKARVNIESARLWFSKNSWMLNKQYQPIKVSVSNDNSNWYEVGTINPIFTSYIPTGVSGAGRVELTPSVPMPPYYP